MDKKQLERAMGNEPADEKPQKSKVLKSCYTAECSMIV